MAVAGLVVPDSVLQQITADLVQIKRDNGNPREVKWSETKARRDSPEKGFADYFEKMVKDKQIHFHIRFAPFRQYDHRASGPNKRVDTTSKMHFQLLLHRAVRHYGKHYKIRIRPDNGDCTKDLPNQIGNLHWHGAERYGTPYDCIEHIQCLDSEREPLLQLLDIPLGAFAAVRNNRQLGAAKRDLADYMMAKWPNLNLARDTPDIDFSVWNVKPKPTPGRGPWG